MTPSEKAMLENYGALYRAWVKDRHDKEDLLEALEALTDPEGHIWHGGNDECTGECKEARAAIAEARRETP